MQKPVTKRRANHEIGSTRMLCARIDDEATAVSAAKTRTWPTLATIFGVKTADTRKPIE